MTKWYLSLFIQIVKDNFIFVDWAHMAAHLLKKTSGIEELKKE